MNFFINGVERRIDLDLNGDGYIGDEGFLSKLERATHIDFDRDNIIGRPPNVFYGYPSMYASGYGSFPSMGYGYSLYRFGYFY